MFSVTSNRRQGTSLIALSLALTASMAAGPAFAQSSTTTPQTQGQTTGQSGTTTTTSTTAPAVVLPSVVVTGSGYKTETDDSYSTPFISVGEKDARTAREVPQSTTVLTRQYLNDRDVSSLDTALRKTPGIVVMSNDNGRSSLFSRGFEFDSLYFNGLPAPLSSIYGTQPDMAIVDHVEILRGPAGLFGGAGEPAGAINMRLKQPLDEFAGTLTASGDSWGGSRAEVDLSTPLTEDGSVRGRVVLVRDQSQTWIDDNDNNTTAGYATLQGDLNDLTTVTLSYSNMERDIKPFNGLPTYADGTLLDVDPSTTTGADWNDFNNSVVDYIGEIEHHFVDGGHAKVSVRYADRNVDFLYAYAGSAVNADGTVSRVSWLARDYEETSLALDAHVSRPFTLWGQEHNILVGADYQNIESTMLQGRGNTGDTNNIFAWNTALTKPTVSYTTQTETTSDQYGLYGQLRVKPIDDVTVIGGARSTWYTADTVDLLTGATTSTQDISGEITPYFGVVYDILPQASVYASYTQIFQPQAVVDASGNTLDPRTGQQYEVGVKGTVIGALEGSAALFELTDKNRAMTDTSGNNVASEEVRMRGLELEVSGEVAPGWDILAGYTLSRSEYVNGTTQGATFSTYTPRHMVQVWGKHQLAAVPGLSLGAGVKGFSDFRSISGGTSINADGYLVVDAMASYEVTDAITTSLTVNNLFDKTYYERVGGTSVFNFYGEPLSAVLRVEAKF
jgi:outer membrane receptor for ferric coprogen and ferric-rhodotorulic acid